MYRQALQGQKLHNDASEHENHVAAYIRRLMKSQMEKEIETRHMQTKVYRDGVQGPKTLEQGLAVRHSGLTFKPVSFGYLRVSKYWGSQYTAGSTLEFSIYGNYVPFKE